MCGRRLQSEVRVLRATLPCVPSDHTAGPALRALFGADRLWPTLSAASSEDGNAPAVVALTAALRAMPAKDRAALAAVADSDVDLVLCVACSRAPFLLVSRGQVALFSSASFGMAVGGAATDIVGRKLSTVYVGVPSL